MVNRYRGEIEAILDGKSYRLCLTLGALAELEHAFGEDDMLAVAVLALPRSAQRLTMRASQRPKPPSPPRQNEHLRPIHARFMEPQITLSLQ